MFKVRKCSNCGETKLHPVSRTLQIYNSVISYECESCGNKVDITPFASIGILMTVGLLVLGFWYYILFGGNSYYDNYTLVMFGLAVLAFAFVTVPPILLHILNPAVANSTTNQDEVAIEGNKKHIARRPIIWLERLGMIGGLLAPLILIGLVLGVAALIGYINFTFFE